MRMRGWSLSLIFATYFAICFDSVTCFSKTNILVRKFIHGCPFAFPCPPPPCDNPVFGRGNCCGSCPDDSDTTTTTTTTTTTAVPNLPFRLRKSNQQNIKREREPFTTTTYPTTSECPYPCTHHGYHYCHPLPCYINCVDAVRLPGGCCYECLNGPNCDHEGVIIPEGTNVTLDSGDVAFCSQGGLRGGSIKIYNVVG